MTMPNYEVGSLEWWNGTESLGPRGVVDTILRLLEQREISRAKALELIGEEITTTNAGSRWRAPSVPWDRLDWGA